jgi:hypothetical protein
MSEPIDGNERDARERRVARRRVEVRAILAQINDLEIDERLRSVLHGLLNLVDDDYGR